MQKNEEAGAAVPREERAALSKEACVKSAVLMKNDGGLLPLSEKENGAVTGALARQMRFQGAGSSLVNARCVSLVDAMEQNGHAYVNYAPGYSLQDPRPSEKLEQQAVEFAGTAGTVLYVMGLTDVFESEGYDRTHLRLPDNQVHLLRAMAQVHPRIVVALLGGAPVGMPWWGSVK